MLSKLAKVILHSRNVNHYRSLGYVIPHNSALRVKMKHGYVRGTTIDVLVEHLQPGSKVKVERTCDSCACVEHVVFRDLGSRALCKQCSTRSMVGARNPFYGKTHSAETRLKLSGIHRVLDYPKIIGSLEALDVAPTSRRAAELLGINPTTLRNIINSEGRRDLLYKHAGTSSLDKILESWVREVYSGPILLRDRKLLSGREVDLYLPELRVGFEANGLFWHSEDKVPKGSHRKKYLDCLQKGVKLYTLWEHWFSKEVALRTFVQSIVDKRDRVHARSCEVVEGAEVAKFVERYHLQGSVPGKHLGLSYRGEVVLGITVGRHHRGGKTQVLKRVCYGPKAVSGGLERLLSKIARPILTWSDNCYSPDAGMYKRLGFTLVTEHDPDYFYTSGNGEFRSKQSQAKNKVNCPKELTEAEWARARGLVRVWDCGKKSWVLS